MMYLEIAARGSGKTTRLLNAVLKAELEGKTCIVVAVNMHTVIDLKRRYLQLMPSSQTEFLSQGRLSNPPIGVPPLPLDAYWFYDEVDYIKPEAVKVTETGYYTGTLTRERTKKDMIAVLYGKCDPVTSMMLDPRCTVVRVEVRR